MGIIIFCSKIFFNLQKKKEKKREDDDDDDDDDGDAIKPTKNCWRWCASRVVKAQSEKKERFDDVGRKPSFCVVIVVVAKFVQSSQTTRIVIERGRRGQQAVRTRTRKCGHATVEKVARRTRNRRER